MNCKLLISEKPQAAIKLAVALADEKPIKKTIGKVAYYELEHNGEKLIIMPAVGHLYNLAEREKKGWVYPVFDLIWKESHLISKRAAFTKPYINNLKKISKECNKIIVATDKDLEGELIGYNIVRFACNKKDAKRMEFSTLTKEDLVKAYETAKPHIDFPLAYSGETRHILDWLFGLNLSRALTLSIKNSTGMFKILSTGRVQGPTLKVLHDHEKEIQSFKPVPYSELEFNGETKEAESINAWHKEDKFWDKKEAEESLKDCKGKKAFVSNVNIKEFKSKAPNPFDLTSLQIEAYGVLGISPQRTLEIAQDLYSNGWISYPRTSSQKLPESINYKKILKNLVKAFPKEAEFLLNKKKLEPNNGKKEDPAHPALYPTGELPGKLDDKAYGLYELITMRFFATFGDEATRETLTIEIDVNKEIFVAKGTRTKERGWHELYGKFLRLEEEELPKLKVKDEIKVLEIKMHNKETKPPARYNEASLIKELEKQNLGTKATRSTIIQNLFDRNYIMDKSIKVTDLGMKTVGALEKYCPEVLDEALTRKFEEEMDSIQEGKKKGEDVIEEAKIFLTSALKNFKDHEKEIGKDLGQAAIETRDKEAFISKCPKCKEGNLQMRSGKFGLFAACDRYESGCKTTFTLPKNGKVKTAEKNCTLCSYPMVLVFRTKKRPQELCINPECPTKKEEEARLNKLVDGKKCPNCTSQLVIKNGFYGPFLACPGYPKCKHIEKMPKE